MTSTALRMLVAAAVGLATAAPASVRAQSAHSADAFRLLNVPYVPQSVELCGGAAVAMVMRYWGVTGVYAESFEHLVDTTAGGIRGADLIEALRAQGWRAVSFAGDSTLVRQTLAERRPPIALIEDRPNRFHYVVIVGWDDGRVVLHDPARAPFRILSEEAFVRVWSRTGYWTLLALPGEPVRDPADADSERPAEIAEIATGPCGPMVGEGVRLARAGELDSAQALLSLASAQCPLDSGPWRELAGLHAVRKAWAHAAAAAREAVARDARDAHAVNILATSLFLEGDVTGALDAWNLLGEPRIDLVDIHGLARTRYRVGERALALRRQSLLTAGALQRGARRIAAVPAISGARVSYVPAGDGEARLSAAVVERSLVPGGRVPFAAAALRAGVEREVRVEVASPTGGGELWHAAWRWWDGRPRVSLGVAAPAPFGGTWRVEANDERQTYGSATGAFVERHRRAALSLGDWFTGQLRAEATLAIEDWAGRRAVAAEGAADQHFAADRVVVSIRGGRWTGSPAAWRGSSSILWRSRTSNTGTVWMVHGGADAVGEGAPLASWPGAGVGHGRDALLRAHPLVHAGVIRDGVIGRRLAYTTVEWRRWSGPLRGVVRIAPALFVDGARAWSVGSIGDGRAHADAGVGIRASVPGAGVVRVDVARGLRDGRTALSVGLQR